MRLEGELVFMCVVVVVGGGAKRSNSHLRTAACRHTPFVLGAGRLRQAGAAWWMFLMCAWGWGWEWGVGHLRTKQLPQAPGACAVRAGQGRSAAAVEPAAAAAVPCPSGASAAIGPWPSCPRTSAASLP